VGSEAVSGEFHFCVKRFQSRQFPSKKRSISANLRQKVSIYVHESGLIKDLRVHDREKQVMKERRRREAHTGRAKRRSRRPSSALRAWIAMRRRAVKPPASGFDAHDSIIPIFCYSASKCRKPRCGSNVLILKSSAFSYVCFGGSKTEALD